MDSSSTISSIQNVHENWIKVFESSVGMRYSPMGTPTIPIPDFNITNLQATINQIKTENAQYFHIKGCDEFSKSIEENLYKIINPNREIKDNESQILIANGAVNTVQLLIETFLNFEKHEEIIMFEPFYPLHHMRTLIKEYTHIVQIPPLLDENGFLSVNYDYLKSSLNEKSRILILTNPNNPTCHVYSREEYEKISEIIKDYPNLIVIEDMSYFCYISKDFRDKYISFANVSDQNYERTLQVVSLGKVFNETAMRCGIAFGPSNLVKKVNKFNFALYNTVSMIDQFLNAKNLKSALLPYHGSKSYWDFCHEDNDIRKEKVFQAFEGLNVKVVETRGTYYSLLDVRLLRGKIPEKYFYENEENIGKKEFYIKELDKAFQKLMATKSIGVVPLSLFVTSKDHNVDHLLRISTNRSFDDIEFLRKTLKELKNEFPEL